MRRSRRLSGLPADVVKQKPARKNSKRKTTSSAKKRSTTSSSSKKENKPPASRSARQSSQSVTRTKRKSTPAKSRSRKRSTPKTSKTPKQEKKATTRSRSRRESAPSATTPRRRTPKQTRSRSAKRTTPKQRGSSKKSTKEASGIHRKTPRRTPATRSSRRAVVEQALHDFEPTEKIPFVVDDDEVDEDYSPEMDEMLPPPAQPTHSLDLTVLGIVICLTALYMFSFCRAMSCSAITKMPFLSSMLIDFDEGATAVTSFLLYVAAVMYCRSWLRKDGFLPVEENAFITLHFVHGLLLVVHLLSCSVFNPNEKQSNCIKSIVALSFGFYAAAWVAQLKFTLQFMRNSLTLCYMCVFYYNGKNTFGLVLLLAAKSVFWMTGAHMMNIVTDERWSLIDLVTTVGCVFMAYVVPSRV